METADVQHLAELSRIALSDAEAAALAAEFGPILGYVAQVAEVSADAGTPGLSVGAHMNIFREDIETHEPGAYTETLLNAAPSREGAYIHVKKILKDKQ